jgi:DNA-binding transcriptional MocR family regulator
MFLLLKMMFMRNSISAKLNLNQPSLLIGQGSKYLKHGSYERHLRAFRQHLSTALAAMTDVVTTHFPSGCRLTQPQGGYMLWVEMPESIDALRLH